MINRIKHFVNLLWANHIFRYSFSWSLILSGIIFFLISIHVSDFKLQKIISYIIIVLGLFLNPELDVAIITKSAYHLLGFITSLILLFTDSHLITSYVSSNGDPLKYILMLIITIPLLTYYIFLTYNIISKSFETIRNNTNNISKFFKYAGVVIGFLISVATLLNTITG